MKIVLSVGLREYTGDVFIAQTLDAPVAAAAAASANDALSRLRATLTHALSHVHPRVLARLHAGNVPAHERRDVALYRTATYDWSESHSPRLEEQFAQLPVDIVRRDLCDGFSEVRFPIFNAWTCTGHVGAGEEARPERVAIDDLAAALRANDRNVAMHRPTPKEFTVVALEVEFEPLDLQKIAVDDLWLAEFSPEHLAAADPQAPTPTATLDEVGQCFSDLDAEEASRRGFEPAIAREAKVAELRDLLEGEVASAVVIVGPPRVGKTTLVHHLAWEKASDPARATRRMWFADPPRLVSTDPFMGDWRSQCREIMAELEGCDGVLYLGRLVEALDAGKYVGSDYNLAQFLKPLLADRRLRIVAEATPEEWNDVERRDIGFARTFTVLRIDDPPDDIARQIVRGKVERLAERESVEVEARAIERAWNLQKRFTTEGSVVGRTIDFVARSLRRAANRYESVVDSEMLVREFCLDTGLPPVLLLDDRQLDIARVRARLESRVMGQPRAVERVADVVGITKAGLASPDRPLGSFLFVGPTGVGKTELARALAEYLFGSEDRLIRIDMSEYSHADAYARLIGEGRDEGDLAGAVRRQPFCVVLLDEIEKAHPGVFDLLLQVLGEARLTDVQGRTTGFQNTIVIMTSNLGVDTMRPAIGFQEGTEAAGDAYASHFRREAEKFFRPEFLARIDQFIAFRTLTRDVVTRIAHRELEMVAERDGFRSQDVEFEFGEGVAAWLGARGWHEKYGARPLKRVIEQEIVWRIARLLAQNAPPQEEGASRCVRVDVDPERTLEAPLVWDVRFIRPRDGRAQTRRALLHQIEAISDLRRRLQSYMFTGVFGDLEWQVENFDLSSQSEQFWADPNAADLATRAERARRVIEPAGEVAQELAALEDLASEAYHTRSFALASDLTARLEELSERVGRILTTVLRAAYEDPDHAVLIFSNRGSDYAWRDRLVQWHLARARRRGWDVAVFRALNEHEREHLPEPVTAFDEQRHFWTPIDALDGQVIALEFNGYAVRPLLRAEDGLHRLVSPEGNAVVDVEIIEEYDGWPFPDRVEWGRRYSRVARVYNFRMREISMPILGTRKLEPDDPFAPLEEDLEDLAWQITESDWE